MPWNQSYVCMACGRGYGPNPIVSNGWKSILRVCMGCEGGYGTNLIVSNGWKSIICVHGMWRRVQSKPDCVKWLEIKPMCVHGMWRRVPSKPDCVTWLEIKPICVHSMLHVLCKIKLLLLWHEPVTWPLMFLTRKNVTSQLTCLFIQHLQS